MNKRRGRFSSSLPGRFLVNFLPYFALLSAIAFGVYFTKISGDRDTFEVIAKRFVAHQKMMVTEDFRAALSDLLFLSGSQAIKRVMAHGEIYEPELAQDFLTFATRRGLYDQIRYIDQDGMERVRVNYRRGSPKLASKDELQNKKDRYYFSDTFKLNSGEIFVSPFDLNVEQGSVVEPYMPIIRFGAPLFDATKNRKGILVLNFLGEKLIQSLKSMSTRQVGDLMLVNADGYWLSSPVRDDEWGFMFPSRTGVTFADSFPKESAKIWKTDSGQFYSDRGLFSFSTVRPLTAGMDIGVSRIVTSGVKGAEAVESYYWKIIYHASTKTLQTASRHFIVSIIMLYLILTFILALGSFFLSRNVISFETAKDDLKNINEELEEKVTKRTHQLESAGNYLQKYINDLEKSQVELLTAKNEAEKATQLKDKFVSMVVHDLKSPLTSINGIVNMMFAQSADSFSPKTKEMIANLKNSGEHMLHVIEDLLNISRLQTGSISISASFFDAHLIAGAAAGSMSHLAISKGIKIINDIPPGSRFFADTILIGQVFANLISNSIKFCKKGDQIRLYIPDKKPHTIAVEDNGKGIAPDRIADLFRHDIKTSTLGTHNEIGTGLGLPFSYEIMAAHGGLLTVESTLGEGSVFYLEPPYLSPNILVAGLTPELSENLRAVFPQSRANILEARTPFEALELSQDNVIQLIVLNMYADMGFELADRFKKDINTVNAPLIALGNGQKPDEEEKLAKFGADVVINTDTDATPLIKAIEKLLQ